MLTAQQKAEAQKKLKNITEQLAYEQQLKATLKKSTASIRASIEALANDPAKQKQLLTQLANSILPAKVLQLDSTSEGLVQVQEKLKSEKEKINRQSLILVEEKVKFEGGIQEIKTTILNIQKTVKESVEQQQKKRQKIEQDLEKSLQQIRKKIQEFQAQSAQFDVQNAQLKTKKEALQGKISDIELVYKKKAEEKDQEVKAERDGLTDKLTQLQKQVNKATQLNKQFGAVQKKNFDGKLSLYLRTKKFPQYASSFQTSAKTLNSCKQQLLRGVTRMNQAQENLEKHEAAVAQNTNLFLVELKAQNEKENRLKDVLAQKEAVRARIIGLQNQLKAKKAAA